MGWTYSDNGVDENWMYRMWVGNFFGKVIWKTEMKLEKQHGDRFSRNFMRFKVISRGIGRLPSPNIRGVAKL
jgi:hypothetical protein